MTKQIVADDQITDEQLGQLYRRQTDLARRVREGSLPLTAVMYGLQNLIEGKFGSLAITSSFNPETFQGLGVGWKLIPEEHDSRCPDALADAKLIKLLVMLKGKETSIDGEEKLKRLKEYGNIRLTADWFMFFWTNQYLIPEEWKKVGAVYFDGDVLLGPFGGRCVLCLCWFGGRWSWLYGCLDDDWNANEPSASLAN